MTIDHDRRTMLTAKYGLYRPPMNPALNTTVQAILDAEHVVSRLGFARRLGDWVDPSRSPRLHEIATKAHRDLREAMARGEIEYDDFAEEGYSYDPDHPSDAAVLIHFVGTDRVSVCQRQLPGLLERGADYHAGLLQLYGSVYDGAREGDCSIRLAPDCGGPNSMMTWTYGAFLLVFRCCEECNLLARENAEVGYKLGLMEANERLAEIPLPAWARTAPRWARFRAWLRRLAGRPRMVVKRGQDVRKAR
jgi:hypothetical protein